MNCMQIVKAVCIIATLCAVSSPPQAAEVLYPPGANIKVIYALSDSSLAAGDTLVITRTLVNDESFAVVGLYFSDLLPPSFRLISTTTRRNGTTVPNHLTTEAASPIYSGMAAYRWVLDIPGTPSGANVIIHPGDSVSLVAKFVCSLPGEYLLPLHTTVFFTETEGGFFATADIARLTVTIATDIDDDGPLPGTYLLSSAYPNPFNATVTIAFESSGLNNHPLGLTIYNALGQAVHTETLPATRGDGVVQWTPPATSGTGIYFYRLTSGGQVSSGKLVLLK